MKTFDRGLTWNFFNCDTTLYILGAKMTDQNHAVVVGKDGRYAVTNDGGLNWYNSTSISNYHIMDVDFYHSQYRFAVGGFSSPSICTEIFPSITHVCGFNKLCILSSGKPN